MAISERNLHTSGVIEILNEGTDAYNEFAKGRSRVQILESMCQEILNLIQQLEAQENSLFNLMDGIDNKEDFIEAYKKAVNELGVNQFTGFNLKKNYIRNFLAAIKNQKTNVDQQLEEFAQLLLDELVQSMANEGKIIDSRTLSYLFNDVLFEAYVSENGTSVKGNPSKTLIALEKDGPKIINQKLSASMKKRLAILLKNKSNLNRYPTLNNAKITKISTSNDIIEANINSKWFDLIAKDGVALKESDILELMDKKNKDSAYWESIRDKVNKELEADILGKVNNNSYVRKALDDMLKINPNMFFVGSNEKQIVGLLGELSAYAVLKKLFGGKINLTWIAQDTQDGKQLSIDLLIEDILKKAYGIQVKNTTQDLKDLTQLGNLTLGDRIGFIDESSTAIQTLLGDKLTNLFETSYFNISYIINHEKRPHVIAGSSSFDGIANQLITIRNQILELLRAYAPQLLYIANDSSLTQQLATLTAELRAKTTGNIIYIVGNQPVFASAMLGRIEQEIRELIKLCRQGGNGADKISGAMSIRVKGGTTIVDYLNDQAEGGGMIGLDEQGFLGGKGYNSVTITSSYGF